MFEILESRSAPLEPSWARHRLEAAGTRGPSPGRKAHRRKEEIAWDQRHHKPAKAEQQRMDAVEVQDHEAHRQQPVSLTKAMRSCRAWKYW